MTTIDHFRIESGRVVHTPKPQPLGISARRARLYLAAMTLGAAGTGILGAVRVGVL